jgi:hypothetical protein
VAGTSTARRSPAADRRELNQMLAKLTPGKVATTRIDRWAYHPIFYCGCASLLPSNTARACLSLPTAGSINGVCNSV